MAVVVLRLPALQLPVPTPVASPSTRSESSKFGTAPAALRTRTEELAQVLLLRLRLLLRAVSCSSTRAGTHVPSHHPRWTGSPSVRIRAIRNGAA